MPRIRSRPAPRCFAQLALAFLIASSAGAEPPGPRPSQEVFEALCARVEQATAAGELPASAAAAAEELRFALRRELIRSDAEIEILKLEATRFESGEQARALDRLVAAGAARERRVLAAIRQLEESAGVPADFSAPERAPEEAPPPTSSAAPATSESLAVAAAGEGEPPPEERKKRGFRIKFEPADMVEDPPP